jgi:hypothetical protein
MSLSDQIDQLERQIGGRVGRAVRELRDELRRHLEAGQQDILRHLDEIGADSPEALFAEGELAPLTHSAGEEGRNRAFAELTASLAALDRGRTQAELLNTLLAEGARHASRTVLFLTRTAGAEAWGAHGWGESAEALAGLTVAYDDGAWGRLAAGAGTVSLRSADCATLCSRIESPLPVDGVLVPMVIRDRVAAALYADRLAADGPLAIEALQALTFATALLIESLAFRDRSRTPTLAAPGEEGVAGLPLWDGAAPAAAEPTVAEEPTAAEEEPAVAAPPEVAPEPEAAAEPAAEPEPAPPSNADLAAFVLPDEEPVAIGEPELHEPELEVPESSPWTLEEAPALEVEAAPAEVEPTEVAAEPPAAAEPAVPEEGTEEPVTTETPPLAAPSAPAETEPPAAAKSEPPAAAEGDGGMPFPLAAEPAEPPAAEEDAESGHETVLLDRSQFAAGPVAVAPPPPAPPPEPPAGPLDPTRPGLPRSGRGEAGTTQVTPPSDVDGPGWAFATTHVPVSADEGPRHEEARRLARLLVSEIRLYNEEQVEEGRRSRDLYERLRDDIDRSRQIYDERIDEQVRTSTDYFYQELVRILAAGDAGALGI